MKTKPQFVIVLYTDIIESEYHLGLLKGYAIPYGTTCMPYQGYRTRTNFLTENLLVYELSFLSL